MNNSTAELTAKLESFEQGFSDHCGTSLFQCHCGKTYYDNVGGFFGPEELSHFANNEKDHVATDGSIIILTFEGRQYADCLILLFDATRRAGFSLHDLTNAAKDKHLSNKLRRYPRPSSDEPSEHIR